MSCVQVQFYFRGGAYHEIEIKLAKTILLTSIVVHTEVQTCLHRTYYA